MNLYSTKELTELLEKNGFFFKKNLGQNFLTNEAVAFRIASSSLIQSESTAPKLALEIGPGAGSLTLQLAKLYDRVIAIEIDPFLLKVLEESLSEAKNVTIIPGDALDFDFDKLRYDYPDYDITVCSNLPYYLTSEILMKLLESKLNPKNITVLIQKEAAARLTSLPGSPQYGAITAAVSFYAKAEKLFQVGPGNFIPRPKVDSAVLRLTPYEEKPVNPNDPDLFFRLIRAAFSARRKTLSNALSTSFPKEAVLNSLKKAEIDPTRRGETLSLSEFSDLSDALLSEKSEL